MSELPSDRRETDDPAIRNGVEPERRGLTHERRRAPDTQTSLRPEAGPHRRGRSSDTHHSNSRAVASVVSGLGRLATGDAIDMNFHC